MTERSRPINHAENEEIQRLAEIALDPLAIIDLDGRFIWGNRAMRMALTGSEAGSLGASILDYVYEEDRLSASAILESAADGFAAHNQTLRVRQAPSGIRVWEISIVPESNRLNVSCRDVTRRTNHERVVLRKMELLNMAEQHASLGHWSVDLVNQVSYWSPVMYQIWGLDPSASIPNAEQGIAAFHPEERPMVEKKYRSALEKGQGYEFQARLVRGDGTLVNVLSRAEVELDADGRPISVFGIFQDISARLRDARRAELANRMASLGTFASGLAHEVNNPLAFTTANLDYILSVLQDCTQESDAGRFVEAIEACRDAQQGADRVAMIIDRLRTFSSTKSSANSVVDLVSVLSQSVASVSKTSECTINWAAPDCAALVAGEEIILTTVFTELLDNALAALTNCKDPHIDISLEPASAGYFVRIKDNGVGIPKNEIEHIFDPFYTTRDVDEGRGLGLSTCLGIVNSLGGSIDISSNSGRGALVTVLLESPELPEKVMHAEFGKPRTCTPRLVVVDDEPLVGRAIARLLSRKYEVTSFTSAAEALDSISEVGVPDAILCDVTMPGISGIEFYRIVTREYPTMLGRIAFLTGGAIGSSIEKILRESNAIRVMKPFSSENLRAAIAQMVDGSQDETRRIGAKL